MVWRREHASLGTIPFSHAADLHFWIDQYSQIFITLVHVLWKYIYLIESYYNNLPNIILCVSRLHWKKNIFQVVKPMLTYLIKFPVENLHHWFQPQAKIMSLPDNMNWRWIHFLLCPFFCRKSEISSVMCVLIVISSYGLLSLWEHVLSSDYILQEFQKSKQRRLVRASTPRGSAKKFSVSIINPPADCYFSMCTAILYLQLGLCSVCCAMKFESTSIFQTLSVTTEILLHNHMKALDDTRIFLLSLRTRWTE